MKNPFDDVDDYLDFARHWGANYRLWIIDLLRIYVGIALLVRGFYFLGHTNQLVSTIESGTFSFAAVALAHIVAAVHICGGLLLALGLLTRLSALVQIPILLGAIFFVHLSEGLFTAGQGLELAGLVLINLVVLAIYGPGVLSLDYFLFGRAQQMEPKQPESLVYNR